MDSMSSERRYFSYQTKHMLTSKHHCLLSPKSPTAPTLLICYALYLQSSPEHWKDWLRTSSPFMFTLQYRNKTRIFCSLYKIHLSPHRWRQRNKTNIVHREETMKHSSPPFREGRSGDWKLQKVSNPYISFPPSQHSSYLRYVQGHLHYMPIFSVQLSSPTKAERSKAS